MTIADKRYTILHHELVEYKVFPAGFRAPDDTRAHVMLFADWGNTRWYLSPSQYQIWVAFLKTTPKKASYKEWKALTIMMLETWAQAYRLTKLGLVGMSLAETGKVDIVGFFYRVEMPVVRDKRRAMCLGRYLSSIKDAGACHFPERSQIWLQCLWIFTVITDMI